jgi:anti-anti-sigma regulatory factor
MVQPSPRGAADAVVITYRPEAFASNEAAALEAIKAGFDAVLDIESRDDLDIADFRRLINLLRRCRDVGGGLGLRTSKIQHRRSLAVTGLDKVFPISFTTVA